MWKMSNIQIPQEFFFFYVIITITWMLLNHNTLSIPLWTYSMPLVWFSLHVFMIRMALYIVCVNSKLDHLRKFNKFENILESTLGQVFFFVIWWTCKRQCKTPNNTDKQKRNDIMKENNFNICDIFYVCRNVWISTLLSRVFWFVFACSFVITFFKSHQHCKGDMATFQLYWWRKSSGAPSSRHDQAPE